MYYIPSVPALYAVQDAEPLMHVELAEDLVLETSEILAHQNAGTPTDYEMMTGLLATDTEKLMLTAEWN